MHGGPLGSKSQTVIVCCRYPPVWFPGAPGDQVFPTSWQTCLSLLRGSKSEPMHAWRSPGVQKPNCYCLLQIPSCLVSWSPRGSGFSHLLTVLPQPAEGVQKRTYACMEVPWGPKTMLLSMLFVLSRCEGYCFTSNSEVRGLRQGRSLKIKNTHQSVRSP